MYSYEIKQLLEQKRFLLKVKEYLQICDTSPQIVGIKYNPYKDCFYIDTDDNYSFVFKLEKEGVYEKEHQKN